MIKQFITYIVTLIAIAVGNNYMYAEKMDYDWCKTLLEIKDSGCIPDSVAEPMCMQCAIFQKEAESTIKAICQISNTEGRKVAAEDFNHQYMADYNIYIKMVKALREYMDRKCLGSAAAIMCYDVVKTNSEIEAMFTIFRSRRSLPKNKYTNNQ